MSDHAEPRPRVVVGYDGSPASDVALERAIERVGATGRLYLVHAWEPPGPSRGAGFYQAVIDRAQADAEALLNGVRDRHPELRAVTWETELIGGPAPKAIADVAAARHADEIVLGTRGFGRVRALLGSVAHEVIHLAGCPVTVIPERMVAAGADAGSLDATPSPSVGGPAPSI
jgi:nucleotide-binding universal stress UspA family protein